MGKNYGEKLPITLKNYHIGKGKKTRGVPDPLSGILYSTMTAFQYPNSLIPDSTGALRLRSRGRERGNEIGRLFWVKNRDKKRG